MNKTIRINPSSASDKLKLGVARHLDLWHTVQPDSLLIELA